MEPTPFLIKKIRLMVNDPVPEEGEGEPLFSDGDLAEMIKDHPNEFSLAAEIWTIKAGLIQGDIESYSAGNEKYDLSSMKDRYNHALSMAAMYSEKGESSASPEEGGSVILKFRTPDVM